MAYLQFKRVSQSMALMAWNMRARHAGGSVAESLSVETKTPQGLERARHGLLTS